MLQMPRSWWRRERFWAGVVSGLFLALLALAATRFLYWRDESLPWLVVTAFLVGASVEWLRLGTRRFAALIVVVVFLGWGWRLLPERIRAQVDWLAPARGAAPALELVGVEELKLPAPAPASATPVESRGARGTGTGRVTRHSIEVHNAEPTSLELSYTAGSRRRPLGRIPGGAVQRFGIEGVPGSVVQLDAAGAGAAGDEIITRTFRLEAGDPIRVTLRQD